MKIALIRRRYSLHGGAERYVMNLSRHLVQQGHQVHIFSHSWPDGPGLHLHPVPLLPGWGVWELVSFNIAVKRLLRKNSFDVVQSFEKTTCQDVYRAGEGCHREWLRQRQKYEPGHKTIGVKLNPFHWTTLVMERRLFEKSGTRFFIANSQRGKKEILSHYHVEPEKITVIYNAVSSNPPLPLRERAGVRGNREKIILFVGSGFQRKGLYFLIQALPLILKETEVRLLIVGRGNRDKALRLAKRLGVENRLTFTGPVPEATPYYRKADLFVLPSIYEPFSSACLEAMAFGLPIVTTKMNGASEDIIEGCNGFIVADPSETVALALSISRTVNLNLEEVREVNLKLLRQHTWDRHLEGLLGLYREILRGKTGLTP
jgi:UDP-glucose:(heptosyl)LPS alpha-1,3-glucosyltransferase